jgi:multimeric flavodoxin WrbA
MKIIAINGSHRVGQNTAKLCEVALDEAAALGAETELIELSQYNIDYCLGCNRCLFKTDCKIQDDDMHLIVDKMMEADGIIMASPNYFMNVTGRMKTFIDRTRPLHMTRNALKGKVGGIVTATGLDNYGGETTAAVLDRFFLTQEMLVVHPRPEGPVLSAHVTGSMMAGVKDGVPQWRRHFDDDPIAPVVAKQLGRDMVELITQLQK